MTSPLAPCPRASTLVLATATIKATPRKANPFAKDSISTPGPSGLKVAAHKALNRVAVKPTTPEVSPTGSSTTQSAFAKFRAMVSFAPSVTFVCWLCWVQKRTNESGPASMNMELLYVVTYGTGVTRF